MGLLIAGSILLFFLFASRSGAGGGAGGGGLSEIRRRAVAILDELLPAAYPSEKFAKIVGPGFDPQTSQGTTCGALPARMGLMLGDPGGITHWGVGGAKEQGELHNAWVDAASGERPEPGDIYLTRYPGLPVRYSHVGVLRRRNGNAWTTADAGQGPASSPRAEFVERIFDPETLELRRADSPDDPRIVVGWISLARWPFPAHPTPVHSLVEATAWRYPPSPCDPVECAERS